MYDYNYGYDYGYGYTDTSDAVGLLGGLAAMGGIIALIAGIVGIITIISTWKIYKKAGKPGWAAIVPIYNMIVLIQIAGLPIWYIVLFFVPIANIYAMFKIYIELAHKFGKSTGFGVLTVFFNFVCLPILAFSKNIVYQGGENANNQMNNNMQTTQYNPSAILQNEMNNVDNNSNTSAPFVFDQNINTQINPIPAVQEPIVVEQPATVNVESEPQIPSVGPEPINNEVNSVPEMPQTNGFVYNATPSVEVTPAVIPTPVAPAPETVPVEVTPVQQPQMVNEAPSTQPVEVAPQMATPEPQVNVIPGMGPTPEPVAQPQNIDNNPNNTTM